MLPMSGLQCKHHLIDLQWHLLLVWCGCCISASQWVFVLNLLLDLSHRKANEGLLTLSQEDTMPISMRQLAYGIHQSHVISIAVSLTVSKSHLCGWFAVSGLGFGFMSGAFSVVNILSDSLGPGTVGIHGDSQHYFISSGNEMPTCA